MITSFEILSKPSTMSSYDTVFVLKALSSNLGRKTEDGTATHALCDWEVPAEYFVTLLHTAK
jgi:hypothetical protein